MTTKSTSQSSAYGSTHAAEKTHTEIIKQVELRQEVVASANASNPEGATSEQKCTARSNSNAELEPISETAAPSPVPALGTTEGILTGLQVSPTEQTIKPTEDSMNSHQDMTTKNNNPNKFDLAQFRIPQEGFSDGLVEKIITTVKVSKPPRDEFFRVHPEYRAEVGLIECSHANESYLVVGELCEALLNEPMFSPRLLVAAITKSGNPFLWPLRQNMDNDWNRSAKEAAEIGQSNWIRVTSNRRIGSYEVSAARAPYGDPIWPDMQFEKLVEIAFRGRIVDSMEHPILRELRGE